MPDLAGDARFATNPLRVRNRAELDAIVEPLIAKKPAIWWLRAFTKHGVACGLAHHFEMFRHHQQVVANEMIAPIDTPWGEVTVGGTPWHFSQSPCVVTSPPLPDQHTVELIGKPGKVLVTAHEGADDDA